MTSRTQLDHAFQDLNKIRQHSPIVHNVTNLVVMQTSANVLLALGASPIMAHAKQELPDILRLANALVINIGTLDKPWIKAIKAAQKVALRTSTPIIFDPVGAGASIYRTRTAKQILKTGIDILRGNASEIIALIDKSITSKGVDTQHQSQQAYHAAKVLSRKYHCVVIISGAIDIIVDENNEIQLNYGSELFTKVTGMGCSLTAAIAAFAAVNKNYFSAAIHAVLLYTLAGQLASIHAQGPASFYCQFIDSLNYLNKETLTSLFSETK